MSGKDLNAEEGEEGIKHNVLLYSTDHRTNQHCQKWTVKVLIYVSKIKN